MPAIINLVLLARALTNIYLSNATVLRPHSMECIVAKVNYERSLLMSIAQ